MNQISGQNGALSHNLRIFACNSGKVLSETGSCQNFVRIPSRNLDAKFTGCSYTSCIVRITKRTTFWTHKFFSYFSLFCLKGRCPDRCTCQAAALLCHCISAGIILSRRALFYPGGRHFIPAGTILSQRASFYPGGHYFISASAILSQRAQFR